MADAISPRTLIDVPCALVRAVAVDAARDADRVGSFLANFLAALPSPAKKEQLRWPPPFLLELGAALRLWNWEHHGIHLHRDAGLPPAPQAIRDAFRWLEASETPVPLAPRVFALSINHLAWNAWIELHADVTLDEADEDEVLEALADWLWANHSR